MGIEICAICYLFLSISLRFVFALLLGHVTATYTSATIIYVRCFESNHHMLVFLSITLRYHGCGRKTKRMFAQLTEYSFVMGKKRLIFKCKL